MQKNRCRLLCGFASLTLTFGLLAGSTPVFSRYLNTASSDYVLPSAQTSQVVQTGTGDYLQQGGNTVYLAPWSIPEYQSTPTQAQMAQLSRSYNFELEDPAANTVTAEGSDYVSATATMSGNTVSLALSLTDAGRSLLTVKKTSVRLICGNTSGDFYIWLLPQGTEIPKDTDRMPVELTTICKKQSQGIHLADGKAFLLLDGTDRNAYQLTFSVTNGTAQGLRYSLDAGETYAQLHDWNQLRLPCQTTETTLLVLDYSSCGLTSASTAAIQIQRQNDDEKNIQTVTMGVMTANPGAGLQNQCLLVTPGKNMVLPLAWNGCDFDIQLEQLVKTGSGLAYQGIEMPAGLTATQENGRLTLSMDSRAGTPTAGTYRILIQWKFEEVVCHQMQLPLFINYAFV